MKFYNTQTKQIETFTLPARPITLYVCGITPYDTTHVGHAFTYVVNDILVRYLEYCQAEVRYVQNVTDIDDDILRKAQEMGEDWQELGNRWTRHFIRDMQQLNVRPPDFLPRATDVISQILVSIEALLSAGVAYVVGGNVYYAVDQWPEFGKVSNIPRSSMLSIANERGNRPDDPNKRDPLDFVLWQAQATGEPAWSSPWGPGRPGWHIECSTMSTQLLGERIDFHSGGSDLLFPHHECEIAQVEPVTGKKPFVRFWLHVAMVEYEGAKMSKSLGNLVMVSDLLQRITADALRVYLAQHHYRTVWSFDEKALEKASMIAQKLRMAAQVAGDQGQAVDSRPFQIEFGKALDNDLDAPRALQVLETLAEEILGHATARQANGAVQSSLRAMAKVLGLQLGDKAPDNRVMLGWQRHLAQFQ